MNGKELCRHMARLGNLSPDIGELELGDVLHILHETQPLDKYDAIIGAVAPYLMNCLEEQDAKDPDSTDRKIGEGD